MGRSDVTFELWRTLAAAFMPPRDAAVQASFRHDLADDLAALFEAAELTERTDIEALRESLSRFEGESLLTHYSSLFLVPPVKAHLNLAFHLDGSLHGPALDGIESAFNARGVAAGRGLRDLVDHLSAQLEFLSLLAAEGATDGVRYAQRNLLPALPRLCQEIAVAPGGPDSPYLALAKLASRSIQAWIGAEKKISAAAEGDFSAADNAWRACATCRKPFVRESDICVIIEALRAAGLPFAHLAQCPDCRTPLVA